MELRAREPHANWWHLDRDREVSYTFEKFSNTLEDQVRRKIHAGKIDERYKVENIETRIDERQFRRIAKISKEKVLQRQTVQPILTFHGTRKPDHVASILKHGYLMPGLDIHPTKGYAVCMARGNFYGDGIYSSTDFDISEWMSFLDFRESLTLLVNLVFIGQSEFVKPPDDIPVHFNSSKGYYSGSHTLISYDHRIIVSGVSRYIIPLMTVTLSPIAQHPYFQDIVMRFPGMQPSVISPKFRFETEAMDVEKGFVRCLELCEDYHLLSLSYPEPASACVPAPVVNHLILPLAILKDTKAANYVSGFSESLESEKTWLYVEDGSGDRFDVTNIGAFRSISQSWELNKSTEERLVPSVESCLDKVTNGHNNRIHVIYVFVDKPTDREKLDLLSERWKLYCSVHQIVVKLVVLNKEGKIDDLLKLKADIQTVHFFEEHIQLLEQRPLDEMLLQINEENYNLPIHQRYFSIPFPLGTVCEGFLTDMTQGPVWDTAGFESVLFKGIPPKAVKIDERFYKVRILPKAPHHSTATDDRTVDYGIRSFLSILAKYRNFVLRFRSRCKNSIPLVNKLSRAVFNSMSTYEHPMYSRTLLYQMQKLLSDVTCFGSVTFGDQWYQKLMNMKFAKSVVHRTHRAFDPLLAEELPGLDHSGFLINVHRSPATEVEPWTVIISHVSQETCSCGVMYRVAANSKRKSRTIDNHRVSDVLPTTPPSTDLERMYCAFVFTRNPHLYIESQYVALLTVCWIETIALTASNTKAHPLFNTLLLLTREQMNTPGNKTHIASITNADGEFSEYLTELYDIPSCCKLLGMLLLPESARIFASKYFSYFAFQVLAEGVMRSCRAMMRSRKNTPEKLLDRLLGITSSTDPKTYHFDLRRAKRATNKFYETKFTNCSPVVVIYVLGVLEDYHKGLDPLERLLSGEVTPKQFLRSHLPGERGSVVQVALYIQGIKFNKARLRKRLKFDNPRQIIDEAIAERLYALQRKREISETVREKQKARLAKRVEEAVPFKKYHHMPKIFTHGEVAKLNEERQADDKLELLSSGLLKHHCCYPECPYFLQQFATSKDKKKDTRRGIMQHLRYNWLNCNYVPNFHENAIKVIRRNSSFDEFVSQMHQIYRRSASPQKDQFFNCEDLASKLRIVYDQVSAVSS
eukprot:gb/GECG01012569.1/.p1 GENE.gb/GECG01012569.1/~~gb/GECG01012569.1/.p1  ORF type:complete len:1148 (+),score=102.12 gb/GECG01012569.1/:1-3444(+)